MVERVSSWSFLHIWKETKSRRKHTPAVTRLREESPLNSLTSGQENGWKQMNKQASNKSSPRRPQTEGATDVLGFFGIASGSDESCVLIHGEISINHSAC